MARLALDWLHLAPSLLTVAVSSLLAIGCSASAEEPRPDPSSGSSANVGQPPAQPAPGPPADVRAAGSVGVVVIDTQKVFFETAQARNPGLDVPRRIANTSRIFELAGQHHVPTFVTFEASKSGSHALPASLAAARPADAREFIKTTFGAMGLPQFAAALRESGLQRFIVLGAETDVCVLQTMLGMRRSGFDVIALEDALVSEEVNTLPAKRRRRQAGISDIGMVEAEAILANGAAPPPAAATSPPTVVRPLEMGFLLNDVAGLSAADPSAAQKLVRLRELLLLGEWFKRPVFAADPAAALAALPANLRSVLTRPILPLASRPSSITQLAVAGGGGGVAEAIAGQSGDLFVIEDALVGGAAPALEPLYARGVVPTTYKTMYYELTVSVDDREWPSPQWVADMDPYYDLTKSPEELPPLVPSP